MLAMDVVDTLRHDEGLVLRELAGPAREADLLERLRRIYRGQGIDVPDRILVEGVRALEQSRFVYTPPPPGLGTTLAGLWVRRATYARRVLQVLGLIVVGIVLYQAAVVWPERQRETRVQAQVERDRRDLAELLPGAIETGQREVLAEARSDSARARAEQLAADGRAALARGDAAGARQAVQALEDLRAALRQEYVLRIVSRRGEQTGVWRVPEANPNARNFYLIVEAVAPDGRLVSVPVTSEEDGSRATVTRWGVRVPRDTFEAVRRDEAQDGIIQRNILGEKPRGQLEVTWRMPAQGGAILKW